jgi:transcriptional regulator with XRE-family HTH domain
MARAALAIGVRDLAGLAGVSAMTVTRFENGHSSGYPDTLAKIRTSLEAAGIVFIAENGGGAGVRLKEKSMNKDPIFVDAALPAALRNAGVWTEYLTTQEAVLAWHELEPAVQERTILKVYDINGSFYNKDEIERLHYGPKSTP